MQRGLSLVRRIPVRDLLGLVSDVDHHERMRIRPDSIVTFVPLYGASLFRTTHSHGAEQRG